MKLLTRVLIAVAVLAAVLVPVAPLLAAPPETGTASVELPGANPADKFNSHLSDVRSANTGYGYGAGFGAGIAALGAGLGIGLIGYSALSAMARQPEFAGTIQINMLLAAALIEGPVFFALIICLLLRLV